MNENNNRNTKGVLRMSNKTSKLQSYIEMDTLIKTDRCLFQLELQRGEYKLRNKGMSVFSFSS